MKTAELKISTDELRQKILDAAKGEAKSTREIALLLERGTTTISYNADMMVGEGALRQVAQVKGRRAAAFKYLSIKEKYVRSEPVAGNVAQPTPFINPFRQYA